MDVMQLMRTVGRYGLGTPLILLMMIAMMVLPLPTFILDLLFTFNIVLSLIVLLAGIYSQRPLDFAVFPTVLLLATLLRLALNVASTRIVLLNGHMGTDAAGQVIKSFGEVVIGGNYTVGLVVFIILVVINFIVVTKGAGRVSEVSARFTLDSMPGKQMAIDADLNAGTITQDEAKRRREEVVQESDFYGSMDGSSKFVRGDAVAGILILLINIVGGLIIGLVQHGMSMSDAIHNYALLTIGDGLAAQVPSLVLSTAAAIMVTRVSKAQDMGGAVLSQVFGNSKSLLITASILAGLGIIPGMPHIAFLGLASLIGGVGYFRILKAKEESKKPVVQEPTQVAPTLEENKELGWDDVSSTDVIGLDVGYRLIPLVDASKGGQLLGRVKGVRKKLSQDLGFLIPSVHIRDNLDLPPNVYRITLMGVVSGKSEIYPDKHLAINPGQVFGEMSGISTKDPAFNLPAIWINADQREQAQSLGYTVVDASTVVATHLSKILHDHAADLLGHQDVQKLLDRLGESEPKLVSELTPTALSLSTIVKVCQNLLREGIPLQDFRTVAENLAESSIKTKDPDLLTSHVRVALSRLIMQTISELGEELPIITLQPDLEQILQNTLKALGEGQGGFEPGMAEKLQHSLKSLADKQEMAGQPAVLVVQPNLRQVLARFTKQMIPSLRVLSYHEIPDSKSIRIVGAVG